MSRGLPWRRFFGLLCVGALLGVGQGRTFAAFTSSSDNPGNSFSSARIYSGQRSTSAWMVRDAADGSESVESDPRAFVDSSLTTTANWSSSWSTNRYVEFEMNSPLAAGLTLSDAAFSFSYADNENAGNNQFCYYFQVRRASTGAVLATHGSSGSPISCETGQSIKTVSTPIPSVSSTDIANDVTIRVFGQHSANRAARIDAATVTGSIFSSAFTLYPQRFTDAADTTLATTRWGPAAAGDGANYQSIGNWSSGFAFRYIRFEFPAYIPTGSVITSASLDHSYRAATSGDTACWAMEVYQGATVIGTHGAVGSPISCNNTTGFSTDNVPLPEVDTVAKANNIEVRMYAYVSGSRRTQHDLVRLNVTYSLPAS